MIPFGTTADGIPVHKIPLSAGDLSISLLTWGAVLQDVRLTGVPHGLTIGSEDLSRYEGDMRYHGALIGPIANRISNARVRIGGCDYELERNENGKVHLHSGANGTHRQVWSIEDVTPSSAKLSLDLRDGDCGLPGNRKITADFKIEAPATLALTIRGTSDADTVMNFANHNYWNLDGALTWAGHSLEVLADHYLPINDDGVPTGEVAGTSGTPMDLSAGSHIQPGTPAFNHNYCLSQTKSALRDVAWLTGASGIKMALATTETGLQIFDGRSNVQPYEGLALEAQGWPDAPNNPKFPSIKLAHGDSYHQITRWTFSR